MANVIIELFWLQLLLKELGIKLAAASILWCDIIGATYLSCNPVFKARSKHIECDYYFVRKQASQKLIYAGLIYFQ
jgi:hypothetical protein